MYHPNQFKKEAEALQDPSTGVWYYQPKSWERAPYGQQEFRYTWHYNVSGNSGEKVVYCTFLADFERLIEQWNLMGRGVWTYSVK